jgi:sialate O-acetylesterase
MGGIHPRVKKIVGTRLALGARAVAYGDDSMVYSGPVVKSCKVTNGEITLKFDTDHLKGDSIMVLGQAVKAISLLSAAGQGE